MESVVPDPQHQSVTPILDLLLPPPSKRRTLRIWPFISAFAFGAAIPLGAIAVLSVESPVPWMLRLARRTGITADDFSLGKFFLLIIPAMLAAILVHELGHLAAGIWQGFRFRSLRVGPVTVSHSAGKTKIHLHRALTRGLTRMDPRSIARLHRRLVRFLAAGPLAGAMTGTLVLWFLATSLADPLPNTLQQGMVLFSCFSVWMSFTSVRPGGLLGTEGSDGKKLRLLLRGGMDARRQLAAAALRIQMRLGRRAKVWNQRWVQLAAAGDSPFLGYAWASAHHDVPTAALYLERSLRAMGTFGNDVRDIFSTEAAFFHAWHRQDANKALAWLERVKRPAKQAELIRVRMQAALKFAQGDFEGAVKCVDDGLAIIHARPDGLRTNNDVEGWHEWKDEMAQRRQKEMSIGEVLSSSVAARTSGTLPANLRSD